jgi:hypothetical protein
MPSGRSPLVDGVETGCYNYPNLNMKVKMGKSNLTLSARKGLPATGSKPQPARVKCAPELRKRKE